MSSTTDITCDVAIIGGGPAGLSAALWLGRYLRRVVLIDSGDPRNWETRGIHGLLGQHGIRSPELRGKGRDECRRFGVTLIDDCVGRAVKDGDERFTLTLSDGRPLAARRLLLATGIKDVWPDVPGLERCYGETAHVCPDCDGYEARDKRIVVIGSGRKAAGLALALTTWSTKIVICTNGAPSDMDEEIAKKLDHLQIPIFTNPITRARSDSGEVYEVQLEDDGQLQCERIFFSLAQYPPDDLAVQLGCTRDELGRVIVDEHAHSSVQHVYAAGDVVHGPQLAVTAMAGGARAGLSIHHSLLPEEQRLE